MKLYTIRDVLVGYGVIQGLSAVINFENDEVALRTLKESMFPGQKPNAFNVHPEDKELWCIGKFDQKTGKIIAIEPKLIGRAADYLAQGDLHEID